MIRFIQKFGALNCICSLRSAIKCVRSKCSNLTNWRQFQAQAVGHCVALTSNVKDMEEFLSSTESAEKEEKETDRLKPQFGTRFLTDPKNVFQHNAWDNVVWDEEQESEARTKALQHTQHTVPKEKQEEYENEADMFWDKFYNRHQNRFFKDRHWLFTEFPELYRCHGSNADGSFSRTSAADTTMPTQTVREEDAGAMAVMTGSSGGKDSGKLFTHLIAGPQLSDQKEFSIRQSEINTKDELGCMCREENVPSLTSAKVVQSEASFVSICETSRTNQAQGHGIFGQIMNNDDVNSKISNKAGLVQKNTEAFGESSRVHKSLGEGATFRLLEVGCGVGNTVFPVLSTNKDPGLMMYCCDFSSTAVQLVKEHPDYDPARCHAFVWDITDSTVQLPFPSESLDVIIMIFVLSAIHPDKMQSAISNLARCLKPGGLLLFRDYGRYDMAQLRFKKGRCLSENFYVRGDGTRVYFFTQEELQCMFQTSGLEEKQNLIDRRLQVNRGRQLKMYRVWIQCKYSKPLTATQANHTVTDVTP